MRELKDFYNAGFGWICRRCERASRASETVENKHSRLLTEGEAESRTPTLSSGPLAKWADPARSVLACPRCGAREAVSRF